VTRPGLLLSSALLAAACGVDPVRDDAIDALGGEAPGVEPGPLHRPGQPCVLCHDGGGPGETEFSLAGTVYQIQGRSTPLPDAIVRFIDSRGRQYRTATNCAGNFFVMKEDYDPEFPVWVKLDFAGVEQVMGSPIFREGSCAACHTAKPGKESAGPVYVAPTDVPFPPGCGS